MLPVRPKETLSMLTRDGIRLDADVYRPDATGPFPVLLMRQPYGRAIASTVVYAHPAWYAAHGYLVVIQDVRGRGTSEGDFALFAHEVEDGADAVNWAADLPGSTGMVGMYGFSYQGLTQLYAAAEWPAALKTLCPAMIGYDLYADWAYEGGAFCLHAGMSWAMQLAAETARRQGDGDRYQTLYTAARSAPCCDPVNVRSGILQQLAPDSFYHDWISHPEPDAYWSNLSPQRLMAQVDLPMLHIGGWYDTYLRGTLRFYHEMASRSQYYQSLWVGPWGHLPWSRRVGAKDFGEAANSPIDKLQIRWFDQFLKGHDTGLLNENPVNLFEMGGNRWRSLPNWPREQSTIFFLRSTGLASVDERSGGLGQDQNSGAIADQMVHDPWRPVPSLGGHATAPAGPFERSALDSRTDVLTYTSEPLDADWVIAGEIRVEVYCTADALSFDLCAVLSEVLPDGRVFNLTQGYRRVNQATSLPVAIAIDLQPVCARVPAGYALRLSLSGACFPAYALNAGTGNFGEGDRLIDARVITLNIHSGSGYPSQIELSVLVD